MYFWILFSPTLIYGNYFRIQSDFNNHTTIRFKKFICTLSSADLALKCKKDSKLGRF